MQACRTLRSAPPPAIAAQLASATRDELQRCGRITQQLRKSVAVLRQTADALAKLAQSAFDADADSLTNLHLQQQLAMLLAHTVESICLRASQQGIMNTSDDDFPLIRRAENAGHVTVRSIASRCAQIVDRSRKFREENPDLKLINHLVIRI